MKITPNDEPLRFDGDNSYPDCTCCGQCCGLNVLAITPEELDAMHECIERKRVRPIDRKGERCPLQSPEGGCMIWEARPQVCRLFNCHVPRIEILKQNPSIVVPEDIPLLDLTEEFVRGRSGYEAIARLMRAAAN